MSIELTEGKIYDIEVCFVTDELEVPLPESYAHRHRIIKFGDKAERETKSVPAKCLDLETGETVWLLLSIEKGEVKGLR